MLLIRNNGHTNFISDNTTKATFPYPNSKEEHNREVKHGNHEKMRIATTINTAGAILAYLIGAGFASGQETMQFFSNWGSVSGCFEIGVIFIVFLALTYVGVCYIGRTRNAADIKALYFMLKSQDKKAAAEKA